VGVKPGQSRILLHKESPGQALVVVSIALVTMLGILGLAVDLAGNDYVHKTAQLHVMSPRRPQCRKRLR